MTPRAVLLDMDGTLLDSERVYLATWRAAREAAGLAPDDGLYRRLVGLPGPAAAARVRAAEGGAAAAAIEREWDARIAAAFDDPVPCKAGAVALLEACRAHGIARVVATSTRTPSARRRLEKAGLLALVDAVVGGDAVERGKPAPDIFLEAARRAGAPPGACAAFEDSETGVAAALAAGLAAVVQVPDLSPPARTDDGRIVAPDLVAGARAAGLPI